MHHNNNKENLDISIDDYIFDPSKRAPIGIKDNGVISILKNKKRREENPVLPSISIFKKNNNYDDPINNLNSSMYKLNKFIYIAKCVTIKKYKSISLNYSKSKDDKLEFISHFLHEFEIECMKPAQFLLIEILTQDINIYQKYFCERIYWKYICHNVLIKYEDFLKTFDGIKLNDISTHKDIVDKMALKLIQLKEIFIYKNIHFYKKIMETFINKYKFQYKDYIYNTFKDEIDQSNTSFMLKKIHGENVKGIINLLNHNSILNPKLENLYLQIFYWFCISQGDLARYLESMYNKSVTSTMMYHKSFDINTVNTAFSCYNCAIQLQPENSHAYNQLGILSHKMNMPFDTLYYFIRSHILISQDSDTSHHSLLALFEDARQKYNSFNIQPYFKLEKLRSLGNNTIEKNVDMIDTLLTKNKTEIWINYFGCNFDEMPDDKYYLKYLTRAVYLQSQMLSPLHKVTESIGPKTSLNQNKDILNLSLKYFIILFITLHGKIYNQTDLDEFDTILSCMLSYFEILMIYTIDPKNSQSLDYPESGDKIIIKPSFFSNPLHLLQILAINLFTVDKYFNLATHHSHQMKGNSNMSLIQEKCLLISFTMFAKVCKVYLQGNGCNSNIKIQHNHTLEASSDKYLLPYITVWIGWMAYNTCWNPLPNSIIQYDKDFLLNLAQLLNLHQNYKDINNNNKELCIIAPNLEEVLFRGFPPLEYMKNPNRINKSHPNIETLSDSDTTFRVKKIIDYTKILLKLNPPFMKVDNKGQYVCFKDLSSTKHQGSISTNILYENSVQSNLAMNLNDKNTKKNILDQIIEKLKISGSKHTIFEIKPKYLVCDTNCMIDHIEALKSILIFKQNNLDGTDNCLILENKYTILIPLIVVSELEKLSNADAQLNADPFQKHRAQCSRIALNFIHTNLSLKIPNLNVLTSQGNLMDSLKYRNEASDGSSFSSDNDSLTSSNEFDIIDSDFRDNMKDISPKLLPKKCNSKNLPHNTEKHFKRDYNNRPLNKSKTKTKDYDHHKIKNNMEEKFIKKDLFSSKTKFGLQKGYSTKNDDIILNSCRKLVSKLKATKPPTTLPHKKYDKRYLKFIHRSLVFFTG
ncbi:unnamed protein product [Gordionus sp. m RMFG-2023]